MRTPATAHAIDLSFKLIIAHNGHQTLKISKRSDTERFEIRPRTLHQTVELLHLYRPCVEPKTIDRAQTIGKDKLDKMVG